jgi:hypothetical protein
MAEGEWFEKKQSRTRAARPHGNSIRFAALIHRLEGCLERLPSELEEGGFERGRDALAPVIPRDFDPAVADEFQHFGKIWFVIRHEAESSLATKDAADGGEEGFLKNPA